MKVCYCGYNLHHTGYESMSNHVDSLTKSFDSKIITRGGLPNNLIQKKGRLLALNDEILGSCTASKLSYLLALKLQRADIFHAYSFGSSNWIKYAPRPFIVSISGSDSLKNLSDSFEQGIERSEKVIVESSRMKKELVHAGIDPEKIKLLLPGIDLSYFTPATEDNDDEKFKILFASAPLKSKHFKGRGIELLLESFKKFHEKYQNTKLVLAWRGKETERLKNKLSEIDADIELINEHISDMRALYQECSVTVVPYRDMEDNKDIPSSAIESLACGTPVISSDCTGLRDLDIDEGCIFHKSGDKESLVSALKTSYTQHSKHAESSRKIAEEHFSLEKEITELEKIYREVI